MTESEKPDIHEAEDVPVYEQVRTKEPQAPFGQDEPNPTVVSDATAEDTPAGAQDDPGVGGYGGRTPSEEMPRVPSAPETQHDPHEHGAAPDSPKEQDVND